MSTLKHFLEIPKEVTALPISELGRILAGAMHDAGSDDENEAMRHAFERLKFEDFIKRAVASGLLQPRNASTCIPENMAASMSVASVADLAKLLADMQCSVEIRITETSPAPVAGSVSDAPTKTREQRQDERWKLCIDAGLTMPADTYAQLPRGIRDVAKGLGITRQALAQELNAHRGRFFSG